jgi:cytochrome c oxidase subunit 3
VNEIHGVREKQKDSTGSRMGMWLFLFTEMLLFGAMFLLYSVYRVKNPLDFHLAASELDKIMGTLNTFVLLTSSFSVALSIVAIQKGDRKRSIVFLVITIALGLIFLSVKYFEWSVKIQHGIYPGSAELLKRSRGIVLFYGLYYVMTGLHGLHVFVGVVLLTIMLFFVIREKINQQDFIKLENAGLYWHLVDIIWIFLFPLFYLIT